MRCIAGCMSSESLDRLRLSARLELRALSRKQRTRPMLQTFNEKNRDLIVNINGKLVHRDQAGISPFDSAVQGGDAVWEGLRLYNGRIFKLSEHLDRLEH